MMTKHEVMKAYVEEKVIELSGLKGLIEFG